MYISQKDKIIERYQRCIPGEVHNESGNFSRRFGNTYQ